MRESSYKTRGAAIRGVNGLEANPTVTEDVQVWGVRVQGVSSCGSMLCFPP